MTSSTSSPEKKRARTTPRTASINQEVGVTSPDTEGSLQTPSPRKVIKVKKEEMYSHIVEEAYIFDPDEEEVDPFKIQAQKQKDVTTLKKPPKIVLTGNDKSQINDLLKSKDFISDSMLPKVMVQQEIPPEAASLEIDLTKAIGLQPWQRPPAYWTGESMKPTLLPQLLLPNTTFHGQNGQKVYLSKAQAEEIGNGRKWGGRTNTYKNLLDQLALVFQKNAGLDVILNSTTGRHRFIAGRTHYLVCPDCVGRVPIVRISLASEAEDTDLEEDVSSKERENIFPRCYFLHVLEVYFHHCAKKEDEMKNHKILDTTTGGHGYKCMPALNGIWLEQFRQLAFDSWIKKLNQHTNPLTELLPGVPVNFPATSVVNDNRKQIYIEQDIPADISNKWMIHYMAWMIYRIINHFELLPEFSKYIPKALAEREKKKLVTNLENLN